MKIKLKRKEVKLLVQFLEEVDNMYGIDMCFINGNRVLKTLGEIHRQYVIKQLDNKNNVMYNDSFL